MEGFQCQVDDGRELLNQQRGSGVVFNGVSNLACSAWMGWTSKEVLGWTHAFGIKAVNGMMPFAF
jgi:hypothetical protein